jgi:hypothetical protein
VEWERGGGRTGGGARCCRFAAAHVLHLPRDVAPFRAEDETGDEDEVEDADGGEGRDDGVQVVLVGDARFDGEGDGFGAVRTRCPGGAQTVGVVGFCHEDGEEAVGKFVFLVTKGAGKVGLKKLNGVPLSSNFLTTLRSSHRQLK